MGWFLINILVRLFAPLLVLALLWALPMPQSNRDALNLLIPVKDGQLCWAAIAFSTSALYEIGAGIDARHSAYIGHLHGAAVFLLAMASILVAGGATFRTPLLKPAAVPWYRHYSTLIISIFLVVWAALVRVIVHFGL